MLAAVHYDPYSYEIHEDPYPVYARLRADAPAYYNEHRDFWALSRYDDVRAATNDWRTYTSTEGITIEPRRRGVEPHIIEMDPPRHTQLRAVVSRAFTPARIARLEAPIRDRTRALISRFGSGRVDVIGELAALLPMAVISEMLGVPDTDQDRLRHAADALLHREPDSDEITPEGIEGATTLYGYFDALIRARQDAPADDLLSVLMTASDDGDDGGLSHSELLGFCFLLIIAGNETTTKLIGNAVSLLAEHPEQRRAVRDDRALIPRAVEETLRFDTSTQAMARCLTRDVDLHGARMRAGTKVLLLFGSANRDERHWPDADGFDIHRDTAGHMSFGHGIHHCLGAALARLEARVALEELLPVLGDYEVDRDGARRVHSGNVRGFAALPLRF